MTCEIYENLLSGNCIKCGKRFDVAHVVEFGEPLPLQIMCPACCPIHRIRQPAFGAVMPTTEGELF